MQTKDRFYGESLLPCHGVSVDARNALDHLDFHALYSRSAEEIPWSRKRTSTKNDYRLRSCLE